MGRVVTGAIVDPTDAPVDLPAEDDGAVVGACMDEEDVVESCAEVLLFTGAEAGKVAPLAMAASTSLAVIRLKSPPVPLIFCKEMFFSAASFRAYGEALRRSPLVVGAVAAVAEEDVDAASCCIGYDDEVGSVVDGASLESVSPSSFHSRTSSESTSPFSSTMRQIDLPTIASSPSLIKIRARKPSSAALS